MFHYFLEVSVAWLLLLVIYYSFLRKETFFKTNRWYLMHSIFLGMLLPLLRHIPISFDNDVVTAAPIEFINYNTYKISQAMDIPAASAVEWNYRNILLTIYATGLVILSFRMFYGLLKIYRLWYDAEKIRKGDFTMVITDSDQLPFSFFKYVFISRSFLNKDYIKTVLEHELVHIKQKHTYDVFALEIISIIFWWNPLIYLFKKAIKETHEYLADAYAILDNDIKNYGHILLGQSSSGIELALTNQFFNSLLKKRIAMLHQKKSAGYKLSKYFMVIPLLCFMIVLFSANAMSKSEHENQESDNVQLSLYENDNLKPKLVEAFKNLYEKSQVTGKVRQESVAFYDLYTEYLSKYESQEKLKKDFTEIACSFGMKIKFLNRESTLAGFETFMYIVPKFNFKAWKSGELPEYDDMVCGPNSVPPPPPPPAPNEKLEADNLYNILANHEPISNLVNDNAFTSTHTFNFNEEGEHELTNVKFTKKAILADDEKNDLTEEINQFTHQEENTDTELSKERSLFILNGEEITFEDESIVTLEGKMHSISGKEIFEKYGKKNVAIAHIMEGKILSIDKSEKVEKGYNVRVIEKPSEEDQIHENSEMIDFIEDVSLIMIDGKRSTKQDYFKIDF